MPAPVSLSPPTSSFSFSRYISRYISCFISRFISRLTLSLKLLTYAPDKHSCSSASSRLFLAGFVLASAILLLKTCRRTDRINSWV